MKRKKEEEEEEETSEGTWVQRDAKEEESTHPMRSSNSPSHTTSSSTSTSSSKEDSDENKEDAGIGRIAHISDIMAMEPLPKTESSRADEQTPSSSAAGNQTTSMTSTSDSGTPARSPERDIMYDPPKSPIDPKKAAEEREYFSGIWFIKCFLLACFTAWVALAANLNLERATPWIVINCLVFVYFFGSAAWAGFHVTKKLKTFMERHKSARFDTFRRYLSIALNYFFRLLLLPMLGWVIYDAWSSPIRLRSIGAVFGYVALAVLCSAHPARIKWKPVFGAFTLQLGVGIVLLRWSTGREKLVMVANQVVVFLDYTNAGTAVVYEWVAFSPKICGIKYVFLYTAMQIIIYFGGIVSLLYYYGIIQSVLAKFAIIMQYTLGTTVIESLNAVACIFLGQTESAVLIGPAFDTMTSSEITTVMCSGFACIAGALFSAYINFGACPEYLLSATVMSASVSLGIAKILYPEIQVSSQKNVKNMQLAKHEYHSFFDAISKGAIGAAKVVVAIGMSLVVYLAILECVNKSVIWLTSRLGFNNTSFNDLVGYTFFPLAYMMGASDATNSTVNHDETLKVAQLMGLKTTVNEFVAYSRLADMVTAGTLTGARAQMIATYALCGFSNISSIGAVMGIMSAMCPRRMRVFSKLAIRGLLGGCISCFLTASVAGILVEKPTSCPPKMFNDCLDLDALRTHLDRTYGLV